MLGFTFTATGLGGFTFTATGLGGRTRESPLHRLEQNLWDRLRQKDTPHHSQTWSGFRRLAAEQSFEQNIRSNDFVLNVSKQCLQIVNTRPQPPTNLSDDSHPRIQSTQYTSLLENQAI